MRSTVSEVFDTIGELVAEWPQAEANMDSTARAMLAAERAKAEHAEAVAQWLAALEAHGEEPCDRCGGAGGYQGWPGFTCYQCGGKGSQAVAA